MPELLEKSELDVSLALENENDTAKSTIQHMGHNNVYVGVGFRMAPSGTQKPEIDFQTNKATLSQVGLAHQI